MKVAELLSGMLFFRGFNGVAVLTRQFVVRYQDVDDFRVQVRDATCDFGERRWRAVESALNEICLLTKTATVDVQFVEEVSQ